MRYRPTLSNGNRVPLSWPIQIYRCVNHLCWPLEADAPDWMILIDRVGWALGFLIFPQHYAGQILYLQSAYRDIDRLLETLPAFLILNETFLRTLQLQSRKKQFRIFLQRFYTDDFYIEKSIHAPMCDHIRLQLRPTIIFAGTYVATILLYIIAPAFSLCVHHRRDLLYKDLYPFDYTPLAVYLTLLCTDIWLGFIITTMQIGEGYILSMVMAHLTGHYLLLAQEMRHRSRHLLDTANPATISQQLGSELKRVTERIVQLNQFAAEFQHCFSWRVFIMFSFAAALICTLGFKVYTNFRANISSIFWIMSKIIELLVIGKIGSTLMAAVVTADEQRLFSTADISSMYYRDSGWELIISRSTNSRENLRLMKLLLIAMKTSQKSFRLTGLNFFSVSLTAVLKILRGASSYFTCLISIR